MNMPEFLNQLGPVFLKTAVSLFLTGLIGVIMWPLKKARKEWSNLTSKLDAVHTELATQRNNCLTKLQGQGETQIELLGKAVAALDGMRLDLRETMGILRVTPRDK